MGHPWPYRRHYVVAAETATVEKAAERLQRELTEHVARIGEVLTQPVKTWSEPCRYIVAAEGPRTEDGHVAAGWREDPERVRVCGEAHTHDLTA